ncbi:MAG: hypothetical protein ACKOX6_02075 [Bdellovibrio sp.]
MNWNTVDSLLRGIGCNMTASSPQDMTPEECLADLSLYLLQDPKALVLAVGAVKAHAQFFQPEILLKAITKRRCDFNVIGALLSKSKDSRFLDVIEYCRDQKFISELPTKILCFSLKIGQCGVDEDFESFGIRISQMDPVDDKKISKRVFRSGQ